MVIGSSESPDPIGHLDDPVKLSCPVTGREFSTELIASWRAGTWFAPCRECDSRHRLVASEVEGAPRLFESPRDSKLVDSDLRSYIVEHTNIIFIVIGVLPEDYRQFESYRVAWRTESLMLYVDGTIQDVPLWGGQWESLDIPADIVDELRQWQLVAPPLADPDYPSWKECGRLLLRELARMYPEIDFHFDIP